MLSPHFKDQKKNQELFLAPCFQWNSLQPSEHAIQGLSQFGLDLFF